MLSRPVIAVERTRTAPLDSVELTVAFCVYPAPSTIFTVVGVVPVYVDDRLIFVVVGFTVDITPFLCEYVPTVDVLVANSTDLIVEH